MSYLLVLLATASTAGAICGIFAIGLVQRNLRAFEREKLAMLAVIREQADQMMHLAGKTWTPPPREMPIDEETEEQKAERVLREQGWINF